MQNHEKRGLTILTDTGILGTKFERKEAAGMYSNVRKMIVLFAPKGDFCAFLRPDEVC